MPPATPGQDSKHEVDIYAIALVEAAKQMRTSWSQFGSNQDQMAIDYQNRLVYKDDSVRADYPVASADIRFQYLTGVDLYARRRKTGKDFAVLRVHPATVEGTRIKVVVSQDWITILKGKRGLGISDWGAVFFKIDADTGQFRFDEVKLGGI